MPSDTRRAVPAPVPMPERPFEEPWQAQAFAMAVHLSETGLFTWAEWTETFGTVLSMARTAGRPVDGAAYWEHWVTALEMLLAARGEAEKPALEALKEAWAEAYRTTPHGTPVRLGAS